MYNLDFADEKSMPCSRMRRFKNFIKNTTVAPVVVREQASEFVEEEHVVPALTDDVIQVLGEKGIVETPYYYVHSTHSSRSGKGDAYAIAFAGLLVVMWRKEGECYTVIKLEANEVVDISAEEDDLESDLITMTVITDHKTFRLWYNTSQAENVVNLINLWKVHSSTNVPASRQPKAEAEVDEKESTSSAPLPEISDVPQAELPKTIIFGTLLLSQVADGHNMTEQDLELVHMILGNPDLLSLSIKNFKQADLSEVTLVVKKSFSKDQKVMMLANMADIAFRNGEPHDEELLELKQLVEKIDLPHEKLEELLTIFRIKNDPEIFS